MTLQEQIELIDKKVNMLEYISQYTSFKKRNGEWWALSPLTDERTPSFSVSCDKFATQKFKDFSSGCGGDIVDFVKAYEGVGTKRAIEILRSYANIDTDELRVRTHLEASEIAKSYRRRSRKRNAAEHNVMIDDVMNRYVWDIQKFKNWIEEGIGEETLRTFGVRYDPTSSRIVFPIRNGDGGIINIKGRTIDPLFKEKGIAKYIYFYKLGDLDFLFGLDVARQYVEERNEIILFESEKSVMKCHGWGIRNTCAIMTSHLNDYQRKILMRLGKPVVFALDKDANPHTDKNIKKLKMYCNISVIEDKEGLLDEKDAPVDKGLEVFKRLYERKVAL